MSKEGYVLVFALPVKWHLLKIKRHVSKEKKIIICKVPIKMEGNKSHKNVHYLHFADESVCHTGISQEDKNVKKKSCKSWGSISPSTRRGCMLFKTFPISAVR